LSSTWVGDTCALADAQSPEKTAAKTNALIGIHVTDAEDLKGAEQPKGWSLTTRQGPLAAGQMVDMGSFRGILDYVAGACCGLSTFEESPLGRADTTIEVAILGIYGSEDLMIGASRCFRIVRSGQGIELNAESPRTRQITRRAERKNIEAEIADHL